MNKKYRKIIFIIGLCLFSLLQSVKAEQTSPYYLTTTNPAITSINTTSKVVSTTMDSNTGLLSAALNPGFIITTNSPQTYTLTMSATATTTSSTTNNAIFNIGSTRYIALTNNTVLPTTTSLNNITSGSPTSTSNPNAIAYPIDDPTTATGLTVAYSSTNRNWLLTLNRVGNTTTYLVIPANTPLSNTFSTDDEAGDYKATVTLSFN